MTDEEIQNMIDSHTGTSRDYLVTLAKQIDYHRGLNNQLADQSKRLRATVKLQGETLKKIKTYCEASQPHVTENHASFVLGTVVNMINQLYGEIT